MENQEIALKIAAMTQLKELPQWRVLVELIQELDIEPMTHQILEGEVSDMETLRLKKENLRLLKSFISFPDEYRKRLISMNNPVKPGGRDVYAATADEIAEDEISARYSAEGTASE